MHSSRLQRALRRGLQPGGNLADELFRLGDYGIVDAEDARAVCEALERFPLPQNAAAEFFKDWTPLHAVMALFQQVESEEAFAVFFEYGIPHLLRLFNQLIDGPEDGDALLFILKILVMYQSTEGVACLLEAARKPVRQNSCIWSAIFEQFEGEHPYFAWLCKELSDPLPPGFIAVAFLDCVNRAMLEGQLDDHPFDTPHGKRQLEVWLTSSDSSLYTFAASAAASSQFMEPPERDRLLALALDHADPEVQFEAAQASASLGSTGSVKFLKRLCLEPGTSSRACSCLHELGLEDAIPSQALEPDFLAMSDMCTWLSHPNEHGRPPDEIELFDTREIYWPPTDDQRRVWLFKYKYYENDEFSENLNETPSQSAEIKGIGMVGSVTFSLDDELTAAEDPLDVYALHCCWELQVNRDPRAPGKRSVKAGRKILEQYNSGQSETGKTG